MIPSIDPIQTGTTSLGRPDGEPVSDPANADVSPAHEPLTPCVGTCAVRDDGLCAGCLRSLDEIARWGGMTLEEQRRVMASLAARDDGS
jgi:uncharacterized protein